MALFFGGRILQFLFTTGSSAIGQLSARPWVARQAQEIHFAKPVLCGDLVYGYGCIAEQTENSFLVWAELWVHRNGIGLDRRDPSGLQEVEKVASGIILYRQWKPETDLSILPEPVAALAGEIDASWLPTIRNVAPSSEISSSGFVRAGWQMSQSDLACAAHAYRLIEDTSAIVVTGNIPVMHFQQPIMPGNDVAIYTQIETTGRKSIDLSVQIRSIPTHRNGKDGCLPQEVMAAQGIFRMICVDPETKKPVDLPESVRNITGTEIGDDLRRMPSLTALMQRKRC